MFHDKIPLISMKVYGRQVLRNGGLYYCMEICTCLVSQHTDVKGAVNNERILR
jgi:hypothetical protein